MITLDLFYYEIALIVNIVWIIMSRYQ